MPKKTERGALWDFSTSILSQNIKKRQGGPFGKKNFFRKKSRSAEKNERGDLLNFKIPHWSIGGITIIAPLGAERKPWKV